MLFNSYIYIFIFLPASFFIYFFLNRRKLTIASKAWLVFASLFFYGYWNPVYVPVMLGSILFNYAIGSTLVSTKGKRSILFFGIGGNLALLAYFKYMDFFILSLNGMTGLHIPLLRIILPLGISFFTFTQIAFLVDTARGHAKEYSFLNYSLFVTFFPHLLAGPIIHHREMMPQFDRIRNKVVNWKNISQGLALFFVGLFKKVVIADAIAAWPNSAFDQVASLTFVEAWAAVFGYSMQLYFDFSGYTDMALGSALLFNIRLPENFDTPYRSRSISEFWRRWHMTLGRFVREYIYIPLGGNRVSESRLVFNLLLTFVILGLWHGAGWTYVIWGFFHGCAVVVNHFWDKTRIKMPGWIAVALTFLFLNATWPFFRGKDFDQAVRITKSLFGLNGIVLPEWLAGPLVFLKPYGVRFGDAMAGITGDERLMYQFFIFIMLAFFFKNSTQLVQRLKPVWWSAVGVAMISVYAVLNLRKVSEFLYFQF